MEHLTPSLKEPTQTVGILTDRISMFGIHSIICKIAAINVLHSVWVYIIRNCQGNSAASAQYIIWEILTKWVDQ